MDAEALQKEIARLWVSISSEDLPIRVFVQRKCELACLLLALSEFLFAPDYAAFLASAGLKPRDAGELIAYMLKRQSYRWTLPQ